MESQVILNACIVIFVVTTRLAHQAVLNNANEQSEVRENFHNLFDSIANNNARKGDRYREILQDEVTRGQQAFDTMNEEFRVPRQRNAHMHQKSSISLSKREIRQNSNGTIVAGQCPDQEYTIGFLEVEKMFRKFHPDSRKYVWPGLDSLTPETLQRICDEVFEPVRKNELSGFREYKYKPVNASELQKSRVIKEGRFYSFVNSQEEKLPFVACVYTHLTFYLIRVDDNHVCRAWKDAADFIAMKSGLHRVHFNSPK